ncbi:hypothetical protein [Dactylosporangium sp. NPDC050588]|uniref:hypothetical protein n=1 Tax=Dactylosporangium sp. NPDC050588 TaxID=3157211 RepID=UPI0033E0ABFC
MTGNTWHSGVKSSRRVGVRPTGVLAGALIVAAALLALAVAGWGVMELSLIWSVAAVLSLIGVLVLTLRGFPMFAILAAVTGAVAWGAATRTWLPGGWTDFLGIIKFIGVNLGFDVPLIGAFLAALMLDARRLSRAAIDEAVSGRRWWGKPDDHLPRLKELEVLPSARFFALGEGGCTHLVVAGRRVALFLPTVWPHGEFSMDASGQVLRGGRLFVPGSEDVDGLAAEVHTWREQLGKVGGAVRGYLVVAPSRGDVSEDLVISVAPGEHLHLVHAHEMVEAAGRWLAAEPYRVELSVMERLLVIAAGNKLPEPSPLARSFARMTTGSHPTVPASPTVADAAFAAAAGTSTDAEPASLRDRLTRGRFGRSASSANPTSPPASRRGDHDEDGSVRDRLSDDDGFSPRRGDYEEDGSVRSRFGRSSDLSSPSSSSDPESAVPASDSWESRTTRELVGSWDSESANKLAAWAAAGSGADPRADEDADDHVPLEDFGSRPAADRRRSSSSPSLSDSDGEARFSWSSDRAEPALAESDAPRGVGRRRAPEEEPFPSRPSSPPPSTWPAASAEPPSPAASTLPPTPEFRPAPPAPEPSADRFASLMSEFDQIASDPDRFGFALDTPADPDTPPSTSPSSSTDRAWSSPRGSSPDLTDGSSDRAWSSSREPAADSIGDSSDRGWSSSRGSSSDLAGGSPDRSWSSSLESAAEPVGWSSSRESAADSIGDSSDRGWSSSRASSSDLAGASPDRAWSSREPAADLAGGSSERGWSSSRESAADSIGDSSDRGWSSSRGSSSDLAGALPDRGWSSSREPAADLAGGSSERGWSSEPGPASDLGDRASDRGGFSDLDGPGRTPADPVRFGTPASDRPARRPVERPAERPAWTGSLFDGEKPELVAEPLELSRSWQADPEARSLRRRERQQPSATHNSADDPVSSAPTSGVPTSGIPTSGGPTSRIPTSGAPTFGGPTSGAPAYGGSTSGAPASGFPGSGGSRFDGSAFGSSSDGPSGAWPVSSPASAGPAPSAGPVERPSVPPSTPSRADALPEPSWGRDSWSQGSSAGPAPAERSSSGSSWSDSARPAQGRSEDSWSGSSWSDSSQTDHLRSDRNWSDAPSSDRAASDVAGSDRAWSEPSRLEPSRPESSRSEFSSPEPSRSESWRSESARSEQDWSDRAGSDEGQVGVPRAGASAALWSEQGQSGVSRAGGRDDDRAGAQPGMRAAGATEDGADWWDAEAAAGSRAGVDEAPVEQPAKRSRWGFSKAGKGKKGQTAAASAAGDAPARRPGSGAPAAGSDWAAGTEAGQRAGAADPSTPAGRPSWATDPTTGWESDPSGEFTSERRAGSASRTTGTTGSTRPDHTGDWATGLDRSGDNSRGSDDWASGLDRSGDNGRGGDDWASGSGRGADNGRGGGDWASSDRGGSDRGGDWGGADRGGPGGRSEDRGGLGGRSEDRGGLGGRSEDRGGLGGRGEDVERAGDRGRGERGGFGGGVPGQRQRARDMVFDDDVAPLELNLDEEPKNPDQKSRRFLRRGK